MPKFTVAIVGAGLSGLFLALALQRYAPDVDFEIYEGASQLAEIGAGIGLAPRTWAMIQDMGLEEALLKISGDGGQASISLVRRKSDQAEGVDLDKAEVTEMTYSFHRAELQKTFLEQVKPPRTVRLGKRLVSYAQSAGGVEIRFQDGTTVMCDVLIGCDGIRSGVRAAMYTQLAETAQAAGKADEAAVLKSHIVPVFSGEVIYRCLLKTDTIPPEVVSKHPAFKNSVLIVYCGKNKHLVTYPISQGRVLNVGVGVSTPGTEGTIYEGPWTSSASREEFADQFVGWEPEVQDIVKHVDGGLKWAINVVTELPTFVHEHVVLAGDAAHAMGAHLGAGAGQCFEDGSLLAQLMGRPDITKQNVHIALQLYDDVRRPFTQTICALTRKSEQLHHLNGPQFSSLTADQSATGKALTMEQIWEIGRTMQELRDWQDGSSIAEENAVAMRRLDQALYRARL